MFFLIWHMTTKHEAANQLLCLERMDKQIVDIMYDLTWCCI